MDKVSIDAQKNRTVEVDIIKALGIICVVAGHSDAPFNHFVYLFHMAIFFIASGFVFKSNSSDSIRDVFKAILSKIKRLWVPYFVWNMLFVLLHNLFITVNVYTDDPRIFDYITGAHIGLTGRYTAAETVKHIFRGALFESGEQMLGAGWFLMILFMISICYVVVDFIAKKINKNCVIFVQLMTSVILLTFGYRCSVYGFHFHGIEKAASFYFLYFIGHILALLKEKYAHWNWKQFLPILISSFAVLLMFDKAGSIELSENSYENPAFLLATAFVGWAFLYSISYFIKQIPHLASLMVGIGKRTLTVMLLHFLSLKIVVAIVVTVNKMPPFCVAAFPNLYGNTGLWWVVYTIVGLTVPVVLDMAYHSVLKRCAGIRNSITHHDP